MWWIIIVAIILFSIVKFAMAYNDQADSVAKQGGMKKKYSVLVNNILNADSHCRIIQEGSSFIRLGAVSPGGSTIFDLTQTFGSVTVQWIGKSVLIGDHKMEWQFDEFMDQDAMFEKVVHDVDIYMNNVINKYQ